MRLDWLGQKPPLPTPAIAAAPNACHGSCTNGYRPYPTAAIVSENASVRRPPTRSINAPITGPATRLTAPFVASTRPAVASGIPRTLCR